MKIKTIILFLVFTFVCFGQVQKHHISAIAEKNSTPIGADTIPSFTFTDVTDVALNSWNEGFAIVGSCDSARFYPDAGDSLKGTVTDVYDVTPIWILSGDTVFTSLVASGSNLTATHSTIYAGNSSYVDVFTVTTIGVGASPFYTIDFEEDNLDEFTSTSGAGLAISEVEIYEGTYSMSITGSNSYGIYTFETTYDTIWATFAIYLPSTSSQNDVYNFISMFNWGDDVTVFGTNYGAGSTWDQWIAGKESGNMEVDLFTNFSEDAWHIVKLYYSTDGITSEHQVWIDEDSIWSDLDGGFTASAFDFSLGSEAATITNYFYVDYINFYTTDPDL